MKTLLLSLLLLGCGDAAPVDDSGCASYPGPDGAPYTICDPPLPSPCVRACEDVAATECAHTCLDREPCFSSCEVDAETSCAATCGP